ncbi:MAG: DUF2207 domain-containing protein [Methanosarcinales archaeon]|jgi:uncharacterized membrane protein|nr:DUF2207 domain-containing protein [Methanosarcinales archaeon]
MTLKKWKLSRPAVILFTVLAAILLMTSAAAAKSYSFDKITQDVAIDENGVTHVTNKLYYDFETSPEDQYQEVYYVIIQSENTSIQNISGYLEDYENSSFNSYKNSYGYEVTANLPQPNPEKAVFVISYEYNGGINVYNDITEFNYILRSNRWSEAADVFEANITINGVLDQTVSGSSPYLIFTHPNLNITNMSTAGTNTRTIRAAVLEQYVPAYSWMEVRILYPRMENPDSSHVTIINKNGLDGILDEEEEYARKSFYPVYLTLLQILIIFGGIGGFSYIYFRYGREPNVNYSDLYEREIPSDTKPALVNAIVSGHGKPSMDAFVSTIMSLADNDYLSIRERSDLSKSGKERKTVVLKFERAADSNLEKIETNVYYFLKRYAVDDEINWKDFQKKLGSNDSFYNFLNKWNADVQKQARFDTYFDSKGNKLIGSLGFAVLIEAILMYFLSEAIAPVILYPLTSVTAAACILTGVFGIIFITYPLIFKKSMGRWTKDGRLFYLKWKNFEKYLTDYSLIEKYPPASIIIWDHYIVYAMALGVADEALKNMNLATPAGSMQSSRFGYIYYYPFFYAGMRNSYMSSTPQSSGGGVGGPGGGFGGGGVGGGFGGGFGGAR